ATPHRRGEHLAVSVGSGEPAQIRALALAHAGNEEAHRRRRAFSLTVFAASLTLILSLRDHTCACQTHDEHPQLIFSRHWWFSFRTGQRITGKSRAGISFDLIFRGNGAVQPGNHPGDSVLTGNFRNLIRRQAPSE